MNPAQCLQPAFRPTGSQDFMLVNNNNNHLPAMPQFTTGNAGTFTQHSLPPQQVSTLQNNVFSQSSNEPSMEAELLSVDDTEMSSSVDTNRLMGDCPPTSASNNTSQTVTSTNPVRWKDFNSSYFAQTAPTTNGGYRFTFTSPTQSHMKSTYSPSLISSPQNRYQTHSFAPTGCSAQWQHSVPLRIHWANAALTSQAGVAMFTGMPSVQDSVAEIASSTVWSSQSPCRTYIPKKQREPVASCSKVPRRPKRHSSQSWEYMCPTSKVHLTEEMIARHLEELRIHGVPAHPTGSEALPDMVLSSQSLDNVRQWKNFKDLEEKLEVSDDESLTDDEKRQARTAPKLHIIDDLDLKKLESHLPQKLLAEIQKPRLEVVLWTPPGNHVKDFIKATFPQSTSDTGTEEVVSGDNMTVDRPLVQEDIIEDAMVEMVDLEPMDDDDMIDL